VLIRWTLRQREIENGELNQSLAALRDEVQEAVGDSERLKGLLRSEGTALEAARKMKRDSDQHFKRVLDECKRWGIVDACALWYVTKDCCPVSSSARSGL
jgi:hypothetical protein